MHLPDGQQQRSVRHSAEVGAVQMHRGCRQDDLGFNRVANIKGLWYSNQRSRRRKDSLAIADNQIVVGWKLLFLQVVNRCAKEQLDRVVMAFRAVNDCLSRNDGVSAWSKSDCSAKDASLSRNVRCNIKRKTPEGRKPRRAVSGPHTRVG